MFDLCMLEIEDMLWDGSSKSDDHIVPYTGGKHRNECTTLGDSHKKPHHEFTGFTTKPDDRGKIARKEKEQTCISAVTNIKYTMLGNNTSWSDTADGVFPCSSDGDLVKEKSSLCCNDSIASNHCFRNSTTMESIGNEFCSSDAIPGAKCDAADNNLYSFPLTQVTQADNHISFLGNEHDNKESSNLLYSDAWSEIGNFDDIDRLFRGCDSIFGLGDASNEDELCWFSSSHAIDGSEDVTKSAFKFSSSEASSPLEIKQEHTEAHRMDNGSPSIDDSNQNNLSITTRGSSDGTGQPSYANGFITDSESKDGVTFKEQGLEINGGIECKISPKSQGRIDQGMMVNSLKRRSRHQNRSKGKRKDGFHRGGSLKQLTNLKAPFETSPDHVFSYKQPDCSQHSDLTSLNTPLSNMESASSGNHHPPFSYPVQIEKSMDQPEIDVGGLGEIEGVGLGIPAELDSSNGQEGSCMSSVLDEISLEAIGFRQLQHVMEQLDIRTKLCIRDSLYRLGQSAEQRHNGDGRDGRDTDTNVGQMPEETDECTGFMDMETNTNLIDRSIAHLLFHRPSDPSVRSIYDDTSLQSHAMVNGTANEVVENLAFARKRSLEEQPPSR